MQEATVMIAVRNRQASEKIKQLLQSNGYFVADECESCSETLRRVRVLMPDILLMSFDMPDMTGLEAATIICSENLCSVMLLVTNTQKELCEELVGEYDITLFPKPVNPQGLLAALSAVMQSRRRMEKLSKELGKLRRGLDDRKLVERAKGILMDAKGISEAEAYRRMQKMSMDTRVAMRDIAEKIIELANKKQNS